MSRLLLPKLYECGIALHCHASRHLSKDNLLPKRKGNANSALFRIAQQDKRDSRDMRAHHEFQAKQMKKLHTFLARWQGGKARLWEFQAGHCHLTLRIDIEGKPGNLHIVCLGPESIHGPVAWENRHFEVIGNVVTGGGEDGYILRDKAAGFEVLTEGLDVFENCKPVF